MEFPIHYLALGLLALLVIIVLISSLRGGAAVDEPERLARLLVTEIKLYNSDRIEKGRRNKTLLAELGEDLERSRKMYLERIGDRDPDGRHFDQAVVAVLAAGDPSVLGG